MDNIKLVAPCLFGTESILADELRRMGIEKVSAENGRVLFEGELNLLARANINSRFAERILINVGEFSATTFTELFDGTNEIHWEEWIGRLDEFPVSGHSIKSKLTSIPDCQKIVKKAIGYGAFSKHAAEYFFHSGSN